VENTYARLRSWPAVMKRPTASVSNLAVRDAATAPPQLEFRNKQTGPLSFIAEKA
jgi:hypothetical protein